MIKIYSNSDEKDYSNLLRRSQEDKVDLLDKVSKIYIDVAADGDNALYKYTKLFDKVEIQTMRIDGKELKEAHDKLDEDLKAAINIAKNNIEKFHYLQIKDGIKIVTMLGVVCKQKSVAIERVGLYIPGGSAPLFSTILMLAIPAKIAGCKEIVLCTPPSNHGVDKTILAVAYMCGINEIYQVGGAQAIAAMALGTQTIKKVNKIFGPGNQYVNMAKEMAANYGVAMDLPAGPSELMVYADESCIAKFVASDLLSQAEHGPDSQVVAITTSDKIAEDIAAQVSLQLEDLPRKDIALAALKNSFIIVEQDINIAFDFINQYAPEHLIIASDQCENLVEKVINSGSIFLGNYSPEAAGDYASGTNHTLPTNGWAKSYSGLGVDAFLRKISVQKLTKEGILNLGNAIIRMAEAEHLTAHSNAVKIRLNHILNENENEK